MSEVLWLGMLLGVGAALSVGPIFVVIVQQAATSGFAASFRVILGSATADLVLLLPALAFAWLLLGQHLNPAQLAGGALVVAGVVLAQLAAARARGPGVRSAPGGRRGRPGLDHGGHGRGRCRRLR